MNKTLKIFIALVLLAGCIVALNRWPNKPKPPVALAPAPTPNPVNSLAPEASSTNDTVGQVEGASVSESGVYTHQKPHFEFQVPEGYTLSRLENGDDGEALIIQSASGTAAQIFISPHVANATLTPEQITAEQPELEMLNAKPYAVGGVAGVYFENHIEQGWSIMNVWFNKENFLFQATAYLENKQQVEAVLKSWKWLAE